MPARLLDKLRDGVGPDRLAQREAVWSIACEAVRLGWQIEDYTAVFNDPRSKLRTWYDLGDKGGPRPDSEDKMCREFEAAKIAVERSPSIRDQAEARQEVGLLRAAMASYAWTGRNHLRDRTVLDVLYAAATERSTMTPAVSLRTMAELTPYKSTYAIVSAIASLRKRRLITVEQSGQGTDLPTVYRLHWPPEKSVQGNNTLTALTPEGTAVISLDTSSPLGLALGVHCLAVYAALAGGEVVRPTDVARRAGVGRQTAHTKLGVLAGYGLAEKVAGGWVATDMDPADVVLTEKQVADFAARALRHDLNRKGWQEHVAARGPRRKRAQFPESEWEATVERGPEPGQGVDPDRLKPVTRKQYEAAVKAARARREAGDS